MHLSLIEIPGYNGYDEADDFWTWNAVDGWHCPQCPLLSAPTGQVKGQDYTQLRTRPA